MKLEYCKIVVLLCLIATASCFPFQKTKTNEVPSDNRLFWKVLGVIVGALGGVALASIIAPLLLAMVGFTPKGIAAGSIAAFAQSCVGSVGAGGAFAAVQSAGTGGIGFGTWIVAAAVGGSFGYSTVLDYLGEK
jgi:hypothetical protein